MIDDEQVEDDEPAVVVTSPARPTTDFTQASRPVWLAAQALGWETRAWRSATHHPPVLYMTTTETHNAGGVKTAEEDREHLWMEARAGSARLGFRAHWQTRTTKGPLIDGHAPVAAPRGEIGPRLLPYITVGPSLIPTWVSKTAFVDVLVYDPVGFPVENWARYETNKNYAKVVGFDYAKENDQRRAWEYNDGTSRMETAALMKTTTDFFAWLDEWLDLKAPDHKKLSKKPRTTTEEPEFPDLLTTEWSAS